MRPGSAYRVVAGVTAFWLAAGILAAGQAIVGPSLQGRTPPAVSTALRSGIVQMLPWVPVSLLVIAVASRFPLTREQWPMRIAIHAVMLGLVSIIANVLIVLSFWIAAGRFRDPLTLLREGARWAAINFHVTLIVYAGILGVVTWARDRRERREKALQVSRVEAQLALARLDALSAQIRPHFLFNTLHTVGQLWRSGRADEADTMLDRLGSLFHRVLRSTQRREITLEEELELVREYFSIEEARFGARLSTSVECAPDALPCLVPPLILQPLAENAVRHGVSSKPDGGRIRVTGQRSNGRLVLTVADDGVGIGAAPPSSGTGTGLRNTRERIAQSYGGAGVVSIEQPPSGGTIVRVELPARSNELLGQVDG